MKKSSEKESRLEAFINNPSKALWTLAIPMLVGMGIQTVYTLVDMIFIGRIGGKAIAAVAFNMPLFFVILGLTMGLGSGVTASIARYIGAKEKVNADNSAEHSVLLALIISFIFSITGLMYGERILNVLGAENEILQLSWSYLKVICIGLTFMVYSSFFRSILAGEGDMKLPMIVSAIGTVMNIILDPIFIFTLGLGVQGAAIATIVSQAVVFSIFVYLLFFKDHAFITFRLKDFSFSKPILAEIFKVGIPASLSMVIMSVGQGVFNRILVYYSADSVAAYQIGGRIDMVIFLPIMAIAAALTTLVGMFFGARDFDKLRWIVKYGITRSVIITFAGSTTVFILAPIIVQAFTSNSIIYSQTVLYLRLITLVYPLVAVGMTSGRIMQGLGKGFPMLAITILRVLGVSAPLALIFSFVFDKPVQWIWYSMMIATCFSVITAVVWLRYEFKKLARLEIIQENVGIR
jgi:putative MATE family efflux protein